MKQLPDKIELPYILYVLLSGLFAITILGCESNKHALHEAVHQGDVPLVAKLLNSGYDPNSKDRHDNTPLHIIASGEKQIKNESFGAKKLISLPQSNKTIEEITYLLIECGAGLNLKNNSGNTPLHICIRQNNHIVSKILITNNAKLNIQNQWGMTPLHYAVMIADTIGQKQNFDLIQLMLRNGGDPNIVNENGISPYEQAKAWKNSFILRLFEDFKINYIVRY